MTNFLTELEKLDAKATSTGWHYDGIDFIMASEKEGNNLVVEMRGVGANFPQDENAALICLLRNKSKEIAELVKAAKNLYPGYYRDQEDGHPYDQTAQDFIEALNALMEMK